MNKIPSNFALAIAESSPDAIFIEDFEGNVLEVNDTACRLHGLSRDKLVGRNVINLVPEAHRAEVKANMPRMASGELKTLETFIWTADRQVVPIEIRGSHIEYGGKQALLLIVRDVSERKNAEMERRRIEEQRTLMERKLLEVQKFESLGVLAGGIAHDFNNLLQGIMGNATLCRRELPAISPLQGFLKSIEESSLQASKLCDQMQTYAGQQPFTIERIELNSVIENSVPLFKLANRKTADIRFELASSLPEIAADSAQIRQVILNLVTNAAEAIGDKAGVVTIRTGTRPIGQAFLSSMVPAANLADGAYVYLEISDTGCGMTEETVRRIFDPFFSTKFPGRGLGLAAALGIVRGHQGGIKVESEPGKGSTFTVLLPTAPIESAHLPPTGQNTAKIIPITASHGGTGVLLVVDDMPHVLDVVRKIAKPLGFEVVCAPGGLSAVRLCRENKERLTAALVDMNLPDLNGREVFRELRDMRADMPILLMSGNNSRLQIGWIEKETNVGFLKKPFTLAELRNRLKVLLGVETA